ncbi:alpha-L-rhamnosidase C-terminal domain-containing protein [Bifidobacterium sp. ESL0764]|uniref:alpha-L-rhamnosidase-related protein n=1 Tax=Bifidobacterium sp. ESL0764 TaxID=2983228 RepID=UPI0023F9CC72|nr:alpha-L-rhamnosidase C-terminal domain-containing protein [Bifidobacterium sp. ESL0764]WEV66168.1 hypothetical protein OZX71_02120 [Bifidobacterium sp. ESL0764]
MENNQTPSTTAQSHWIWPVAPNGQSDTAAAKQRAVFANFRKILHINTIPEHFQVRVCADARYKLFVNGTFIQAGPAKTDSSRRCYDLCDIAGALHKEDNVIAATVLHYPSDAPGNNSVVSTTCPGFWLESMDCDTVTGNPTLATDASWQSRIDTNRRIVSENPFFAPLQIMEDYAPSVTDNHWMTSNSSSFMDWSNSYEYTAAQLPSILRPDSLQPRAIPFMRDTSRSFRSGPSLPVTLEPGTVKEFVVDAGELMTGYLKLALTGGAGSRIDILQSEGYVKYAPEHPSAFEDQPVKGDRTDSEHGVLAGYTDTYHPTGRGTTSEPEIYEPFWLRTFRFVRLKVTAGKKPVTIVRFDYRQTEYPLDATTTVNIQDKTLNNIWDMSLRTLRRCMHETYEDCPFYEQLQYIMDSRTEILYTYAVSADDRLARQAIEAFSNAKQAEGLLNASWPNNTRNVIPGYSLYFVGILYDHMMYFDDTELLKKHMPLVDDILGYFHDRLTKDGIVGKVGGIDAPDPCWSFIDWTSEWNKTRGVPTAILDGPLTMESLLYIMALQYASKIYKHLGDQGKAETCAREASDIQKAVNLLCRDAHGMYTDGPSCSDISQHCQVFAALTHTSDIEQSRKNVMTTLEDPKHYAQCSIAMAYYLFRALEELDLYDETSTLWTPWQKMLSNHMTTCAEDDLKQRSDCHAWGALALYELPSAILGVKPSSPGYRSARISPHAAGLEKASGSVATPHGPIQVSWKKDNGKGQSDMSISFNAPSDIEVEVIKPHKQ